jgi:hypothetical protein
MILFNKSKHSQMPCLGRTLDSVRRENVNPDKDSQSTVDKEIQILDP